jgi:hypothetical protein
MAGHWSYEFPKLAQNQQEENYVFPASRDQFTSFTTFVGVTKRF